MRIKVKNKHLFFTIVFVLLTVGAVYVSGGDYLWYQAQRADNSGDNVQALAFYDALIERYPKHRRIPDALYWSADLLPSFDTFIATFFPSRSSVVRRDGGIPELPQGALTREERYLRIREEYSSHWAAAHVAYKLAEVYYALGDPRSEELYLEALRDERATRRLDAALQLIRLYEGQNRLSEALEIIAYCQNHLPNHDPIRVQMKLGDLLASLGDWSGARTAYEEVLSMAKTAEEDFLAIPWQDPQDGEPMRASIVPCYEEQIKAKLVSLGAQEFGEPLTVRGRVTLRGQPLAGANVYANQIVDGQRSYYYYSDQPGLWVTSSDGSFVGTLEAGHYEFGIGLNYHQAKLAEGTHLQILNGELDLTASEELPMVEFRFVEPVQLKAPAQDFIYAGGPIEIQWDAYPGAHQYGISVAGVTLGPDGSSSSVSAHTEKTQQTGFLFDRPTINNFGLISYDSKGVDPACFVGRPESYDRLNIAVRALDEEGHVISSSGGLFFGGDALIRGDILVQTGRRSQAEQLLFDRKYDEAVELLEKQVEENPHDVDALWILAHIYYCGTHNKAEDVWDRRSFSHLDLEKSLQTLRRIRELRSDSVVEEAITTVLMALERSGF